MGWPANDCRFGDVFAGSETISQVLASLWHAFVLPAKGVFSLMPPRVLYFFEVQCNHDFGFAAGVFSAIVWLIVVVSFITSVNPTAPVQQ